MPQHTKALAGIFARFAVGNEMKPTQLSETVLIYPALFRLHPLLFDYSTTGQISAGRKL
jgi:hypothetical protein